MSDALKGLYFFARFANSFSRLGFRQRKLTWRDETADFSGQRWLVTGASGGIGQAIAENAATAGATVTALARSSQKLAQLGAPDGRIVPLTADLSLSAEVHRALDELVATRDGPFDVLVNNVGVLLNEHELSAEGFELSFATNLLNHYLLTEGLIERELLAKDAAVINMSSGGMYNVPLSIRHLNELDPERYNGVTAYAYQKRAQVVLADAWQQQHGPSGLKFYVMHPGWVDTQGVKTSLPGFRALFKRVLRNADEGADTALWLASTRPEPSSTGSIWFDRAERPAHLSRQTSDESDSPEALIEYLQDCLGSLRNQETG